ncbi:hypothetical protein EYF80_063282 [Liparis tanakae]|uniref:Uncharacterized protein n=1 Tax=Liparis tanakae TaxID=230148 RepID=A0A4Z2EE76_9TELE|nr:hypothetical protein EYF80_063282 [Liparis tanakae]
MHAPPAKVGALQPRASETGAKVTVTGAKVTEVFCYPLRGHITSSHGRECATPVLASQRRNNSIATKIAVEFDQSTGKHFANRTSFALFGDVEPIKYAAHLPT